MTKFILHGGKTTIKSRDNSKFFQEIVKNMKKPKILMCYFARPKKEWHKLLRQDKRHFTEYTKRKDLKLVLADKKGIRNQIISSDVIYFRGGDTEKLQSIISKIKNLKEIFKNKVIAGSSAGAYILSRYYINHQIEKGLGILPIKTIAHYSKDKYEEFEELKKFDGNLRIIKLPEEKFIVIKTLKGFLGC